MIRSAVDSVVAAAGICPPSTSGFESLATFLGGAAIAVAAEPMRRRLFAPELGLYFEQNTDHLAATPAYIANYQVQAMYVRAKVINHSLFLAKRCRVFLVNVERRQPSGEFARTIYCDSIQLAWAVREGQQYDALDIPKAVPFFVDICSTLEGSKVLQPQVHALPLRYQSLFAEPGVLRLSLRVAGDGAKAADLQMTVDWKGSWNDIIVTAT